jgi:hypothetical protein
VTVVGRAVSRGRDPLAWLALWARPPARGGHDPLLRPVVHTFVRGVGGAVATFSGPNACGPALALGRGRRPRTWRGLPALSRSSRAPPAASTTTRPRKDFGLLSRTSRSGPTGGDLWAVSALWEHVPGGIRRQPRAPSWIAWSSSPDEEDGPERWTRTRRSCRFHRPRFRARRLHPMFVCSHCGSLHETELTEACAACNVQGAAGPVQVVRTKEEYCPGAPLVRGMPGAREAAAHGWAVPGAGPSGARGGRVGRARARAVNGAPLGAAAAAGLRGQPPGRRVPVRMDARPRPALPLAGADGPADRRMAGTSSATSCTLWTRCSRRTASFRVRCCLRSGRWSPSMRAAPSTARSGSTSCASRFCGNSPRA